MTNNKGTDPTDTPTDDRDEQGMTKEAWDYFYSMTF